MSVRALAWAFEQPVDATAKLVLLALADHASEDGDCWVGMRTLEAKTSLKERAIQLACRRLEASGLIHRSARFQGERQTTNLWAVRFREPATTPPALHAPSPGLPPASRALPPAPDAPPGAHQMHPKNHPEEPSREPTLPPTPPKGGAARRKFDSTEFDHLVPLDWHVAEFLDAWHEWALERRDRGKRLTPRAAEGHIRQLLEGARTPQAAVEWLRNAITKQWSFPYEPKDPGFAAPRHNPRQEADDALRAQILAREANGGHHVQA